MRLPTKKRLRKAKEKPEKPEFSRLFGHGADDGTSARGGLSRQTVHRTVWSYGQIAKQFSPYFKSLVLINKISTTARAVLFLLVRTTGLEPT